MRALVTGATGFTGGHLARALSARGDAVSALVREPGDAAAPLERSGVTIVPGDLRDPQALAAATRGVDVVYHIAAIYREAGRSDATYRAVNATAVRDIVEAAARGGAKRVVHCRTVGVHGDVEHPPANEDAPLKPGDIYQQTKLEVRRWRAKPRAHRHRSDDRAPVRIYGPADRRLLKLFRPVARGRWITSARARSLPSDLHRRSDGFHLCGTHPAAANRTYILAGGEVTTLNALVALVAEGAGVPPPKRHLPVWPVWTAGAICEAVCAPFGIEPPLYRRRVDFFTKSRAFDIARARAEIGFAPRVGLREGIRRTLDWYRNEGWL